MKSAIVYFSATGVTKKLAECLAQLTSSELLEIVPKDLYSKEDLDWRNKESRSSIEMADRSSRPELASSSPIEKLEQYELIFLGFPIWWGVAPTIVNTFLEQNDLENKKIALFATSEESGMGETKEALEESLPHMHCLGEKRFGQEFSKEEIAEWVNSLDL
ncbi:flavodoxin [Atopobacter sp. AH10]|uniref:flavodoxin n=1 Tax=Atopobacter sp. AH10 TaxID=2315861 RepID=UPI000EF25B55|nr:flavodoxin [Atopobacter sp. AH10]RLK64137.1 flavodoxin [Atopobacter sp. AH10]